MLRNALLGLARGLGVAALAVAFAPGLHAQTKPNILVMFGDDIGYWNVSAYNRGMMGYRTPNIDSIAREGAIFTDAYAQQSCTAGRAAFITGQSPVRTGLTKVGLPGAPEGLSAKDPTIADLLKAQGYMTGQFGKNHLGDRNEFFPTLHGFDEFFGNFYHLNAEEEPENEDYPKNPEFKARFGPRGVFRCVATDRDSDLPDDPRFGRWGKQRCEDTGPLNRKRMETIDYEVAGASMDFMSRAVKSNKPFFLWFNTSRMHIWTRLRAEAAGRTGLGVYPDGMVEHDYHIGLMLKKLDELGITKNTIVIWTTDNGAEAMSWPDGGTTPFRGEKNTNWEGGYRVPFVMRWPGVIKPGIEINDIVSHEDWLPTLMAAVGQPDVKGALAKGATVGGVNYKVHLDGYNLMPALAAAGQDPAGAAGRKVGWPRQEFLYWTDDGDLAGLRYQQYKIAFMEQRAHGFDVWQEPMVTLRLPKLFNLRADPFERADHEGMGYQRWRIDRAFVLVPAQTFVGNWLQSFREFPPRQKPGSFSLGDAMDKLTKPAPGSN
jgi:arylsulfatase